MKKKKISAFGGILAVAMMAFMLVGIFYTPYDPEAMDPFLKFAPASLAHPFGCDQFGRDIFSRVLEGGVSEYFAGSDLYQYLRAGEI